MQLKIMTFNLRVDAEIDGINRFPNRADRILETIRTEKPDLIGFQEAKDAARAFLQENLGDTYVILGCGRTENYRGESCPLAYRKDSFELISYETQFLSTTPSIPGSQYMGSDQSHCPRLYVHAELSHNDSPEKPLHFFNTHLDHRGQTAMVLGMTQILQRISECKGDFVLTGDMNASPDSACIAMALAQPNVKDATASLPYTFHDYGRRDPKTKIDYIFTNAEPIEAHLVEDIPVNGIYISDHYPVCATLEINKA